VAKTKVTRDAHIILAGKPDGKRPLERPKRRWNNKTRRRVVMKGGRWKWLRIASNGCYHSVSLFFGSLFRGSVVVR
jgi:hypothetical protein